MAKHYPSPNYDTIIEPFAGSAAYSLFGDNWQKNVILIEKDKQVGEIWEWLIEEATPSQILGLPDLTIGEKSSEFFHIIHAATKQAFKYKTIKVTPVLARNWEISKRVISANLHKIKHWSLIVDDYTNAPNVPATWFIDPPYKDNAGLGYRHSSADLDYNSLADWVHSRQGEVICCEGASGDYLPFDKLLTLSSVAGKKSTEKLYYASDVGQKQLALFA